MSFSKFFFLYFLLSTQVALAETHWRGQWTSVALRALPVYYEHQNWKDSILQHQVEAIYDLSKFQTGFQKVQARLAYTHPLKPVPDPDIFGFQDFEAILTYKFNPSIQVFASGLLPLSKASIKKPLIMAGSLGVSSLISFFKESHKWWNLKILFRHFISLNAHHSVLGSFMESYIYNNIISLNHEILVKSPVYSGLTLESALGFQNLYPYSDENNKNEVHHAWSAELRLLYTWKKLQLAASLMRKWNPYDRIVLYTHKTYPWLFASGITLKL